MGKWVGVITNAGNKLFEDWVNGTVLHLDNAAAGTGTVPDVGMLAQTKLVSQKQTVNILSGESIPEGRKLKVQITAPQTGYMLNQIGLWGHIGDNAPVMFALFQNTEGVAIPSFADSLDFAYTFYSTLAVSNQGELEIHIDPDVLATIDYVDSAIQEQVTLRIGKPNGIAALDSSGKVPAAQLPDIDVSGAINAHDADTEAHPDIRGLVGTGVGAHNSDETAHPALRQAIGTAISNHDASETAHADIRQAMNSKAAVTHTHSDYLPLTGGTLTGDLRIKGSGNYGTKINLGDGDYVHISEPTDDNLEIKAKNINFVVTGDVTKNGAALGGYVTAGRKSGSTLGNCATAEGKNTTSSGLASHAEGENTSASGASSHAEGIGATAIGGRSHAEGTGTVASGLEAHAEGDACTASGDCSHAGGSHTTAAGKNQTAIGYCNKASTNSADIFIIGDGAGGNIPANCFRVTSTGAYAKGNYNASGADYAEMFEWLDGNPENQDRAGLFVTLDGEKIRLAVPDDDFILGVVSGNPSVVGDVYDDQWRGMFKTDIFGRPLWETVDVPAETMDITREDGSTETIEIRPARTETRQKLNPNYNNEEEYLPRSKRPEWDAVGMMGKLVAVDDGSCIVNGWCTVGAGGIATKSNARTRYRVMDRLDDTHIRILIL